MNIDEVWAAIDTHRARTADLLESLTDEEFEAPSLCDGWTVRDVAAHLTLQDLGFWTAIAKGVPLMVRHRGGTNTVIHYSAKEYSRLPKEELIRRLRALIGARKHNFGLSPREPLVDVLVHSQDIAIPLGRQLELPIDAAAAAARHVVSYGNGWKSKVFKKFAVADVRLTAIDTDFAVGEGPEVQGTMTALLLLLVGRTVALDLVEGPGLKVLT
ncbi:maleylpyruvate isomerase family mycothiol-dependent enzyme [Smaragdicoccus niigatensis]|uniref:maleylpyruvate isomerase family mycothiol-dependent enzyme n=1 Tax=Smaragdicoccus niigatensis TaxID=359359 RepID=UPI0003663AE4|nr:maleylpyruvate isomerase family mycothiol-dependent enzyme [Smaragdicoccus niigatensis]